MTDAQQRIAEIRARAEKAFPGPWTPGIYHSDIWAPSEKGGDTKIMDIRGWGYLTGKGSGALGLPEDEAIARQKDLAEFVAGCRADIPYLLQHIADLTKERDAAYQDGQIAMRNRIVAKIRDAFQMVKREIRDDPDTSLINARAQKIGAATALDTLAELMSDLPPEAREKP